MKLQILNNLLKSALGAGVFALALFAVASPSPAAAAALSPAVSQQLSDISVTLVKIQHLLPQSQVLGVSTTTVQVRPACRLVTDKLAYKIGDTITATWQTTGGRTIQFVPSTSGFLNLPYPAKDNLPPQGSATISTDNVSMQGVYALALQVTSSTGKTITCNRFVSLVESGTSKSDVKSGAQTATLEQLKTTLAQLTAQRDALNTRISKIETRIATLEGKLSATSTTQSQLTVDGFLQASVVTPAQTSTQHDYVTYTMTATLTAKDQDVYIPRSAAQAVVYSLTDGSGTVLNTTDNTSVTSFGVSGTQSNANYFYIPNGKNATLTFIVKWTPNAPSTAHGIQLQAIHYAAKAVSPTEKWVASPASTFRTDAVSTND